jgi:hypothetical protein
MRIVLIIFVDFLNVWSDRSDAQLWRRVYDRKWPGGACGLVNWLKVLNVRSCCLIKVIIVKCAWISQAPSNTLTMVFNEKIYVSNCRRQGQVV